MVVGLKNNMVTDPTKQPTYEVITREDMKEAFRDALQPLENDILARLDNVVNIFASSQPTGLWTWDYMSRWDYDQWQ